MKIRDVVAVIENFAPLSLQESYDNSGLIVGRLDDEVHAALLAVDVTEEVLDYCDAEGIYVAVTAPINSSSSGNSRKRGGNPSNDPKWREDYVERTLQLYYTTKRHTSVVAYVLADDSANGICLYESYLALKAVVRNRPVFYFDGSREWNSDHLK